MTWADNVNGTYEAIGGLFMLANCIKVYKDKAIKGISLASATFFCSWGWWNIVYYPTLDQWMSTFGAIILTFFNTIWIGQAIYYTRRNKQLKEALDKSGFFDLSKEKEKEIAQLVNDAKKHFDLK